MSDDLNYDEEAQIDDLLAAFAARIERDVEEMRRQIIATYEECEVAELERWWRS